MMIFGLIIVFIAVVAVTMYNGLVRMRNQVKNAWAQIDVQLKRRHDLIPNLVETVKGYAKHEKETLENVTRARNLARDASDVESRSAAEKMVSSSLLKLFAVAEQYPDLKANQNFLALQGELSSTENMISSARQYYNDSVMIYNTKIQSVPTNIIASMFGFREEKMFEIDLPEEKEVPKVSFE